MNAIVLFYSNINLKVTFVTMKKLSTLYISFLAKLLHVLVWKLVESKNILIRSNFCFVIRLNQGYDQDEWDSDFDENEDQQAMPPPSGKPEMTVIHFFS